jgi:hypothetical protein
MTWVGVGLAALALLGGGLLFGGTLVSAQEPTPEATEEAVPDATVEPDAPDEATPGDKTPSEDDGERSKEECDRDRESDASGEGTGIRFRSDARTAAF